ncbi:hypothetical protein KSS87_006686 [Heliosperma pusillum]|nr:hypothetical protein KSS87_006686 [Heliosperma pusillum]
MSWKRGDASQVAAGPWGGHSGTPWDDGVYSAVRQVLIGSSAGINFIQFEYDEDNHSIWCEKHGGVVGVIKTDKIKLDFPSEFLISISGTCASVTQGGGPVIVTSLSFESNRRNYGPFGVYKGMPFSLTASSGMLLGFYGRCSSYLDCIGVYVQPLTQRSNQLEMHKMNYSSPVNPYQRGNLLAPPKNHYAMASSQMISTAPVNPYPHSSKKLVSSGPWGGDSGTIFDDGIYTGVREIQITRSGGLVSIRVCYDHNGKAVWGKRNGGTAGLKLDKVAWGVPSDPAPYQLRPVGGEGGRPWEGAPSEPMSESGPWGGEGGKPWDDGVYRGVRKVLITRGDAICSVQFEYDLNGRFVWTPVHGKGNDDCTYQIKFDYPYEVLTSISGYYDTVPGDMPKRVIRSLTFHTNKGKYGPHGKSIGTPFASANQDGKVVGFHGRSSNYLDAIGVHMQYWSSDETSNRHPSEKGSMTSFLHKMLP